MAPLALTPQQAKYLKIVESLQPEEAKLVLDCLERFQSKTVRANSLAEKLAGRTFSRKEQLELEIESLARYFEHRRSLLEKSLTASEVARLLNTSRQTPHDRMRAATLLGLLDNGAYRFPTWQFDAQGPDGVIDGLPDVLKVLQISDFAKLNWLVRPNPILGGLTPVEALKKGEKEQVLQEARGIGNY